MVVEEAMEERAEKEEEGVEWMANEADAQQRKCCMSQPHLQDCGIAGNQCNISYLNMYTMMYTEEQK